MWKFKKRAKITKEDIPSLAMVVGGAWLIGTAYYREGVRGTLNHINKNGLKVIDANGEQVNLMMKPLIHID